MSDQVQLSKTRVIFTVLGMLSFLGALIFLVQGFNFTYWALQEAGIFYPSAEHYYQQCEARMTVLMLLTGEAILGLAGLLFYFGHRLTKLE